MTIIDVGRVCVKKTGRESGNECVVVEVIDQNFVLITGPKTKRRRCNIKHLEPTGKTFDIKKGVTDAEVKKLFK